MTALAPAAAAGRGKPDVERRPQPRLALGILMVLVACFAAFSISRMFPPQPYGLADDWRVFYAAGAVVHQGGSPYDAALIHAAEQRADHYASVQPSLDDFANLPIVAWALQPLSLPPFWVSYGLAAVIGLLAAGAAMYLWLRRWGWRSPLRWTAMAALSWPALLGVYSGQFDLLLLAVLVGAMTLAIRRHPWLAGAVCALAVVVKPHVLWPLPLLLAVAQLPDRRAALGTALAAGAAGAVAAVAGELLMPGTTSAFLSHLFAFGGRIASVQPDLAGLPGMVEHLPAGAAMAAAITAAGVAATLAFAAWWGFSARARALAPPARVAMGVGLGLAVWLVATPYAHPNDDVLLFPLLALVIGADAVAVRHRHATRALGGCAVLVAGFVLSPLVGATLTLAAAALLWMRREQFGHAGIAAAGVVALAILPMVWPFHVVVVSLTPLAVLAVAAGGVSLLRGALSVREECSRAYAAAG